MNVSRVKNGNDAITGPEIDASCSTRDTGTVHAGTLVDRGEEPGAAAGGRVPVGDGSAAGDGDENGDAVAADDAVGSDLLRPGLHALALPHDRLFQVRQKLAEIVV